MDEIQKREWHTEMAIISIHYGELLMKLIQQAKSLERIGGENLVEEILEGFALGLITGNGEGEELEIAKQILAKLER